MTPTPVTGFRLPAVLLERIDAARGAESRTSWLVRAAEAQLDADDEGLEPGTWPLPGRDLTGCPLASSAAKAGGDSSMTHLTLAERIALVDDSRCPVSHEERARRLAACFRSKGFTPTADGCLERDGAICSGTIVERAVEIEAGVVPR